MDELSRRSLLAKAGAMSAVGLATSFSFVSPKAADADDVGGPLFRSNKELRDTVGHTLITAVEEARIQPVCGRDTAEFSLILAEPDLTLNFRLILNQAGTASMKQLAPTSETAAILTANLAHDLLVGNTSVTRSVAHGLIELQGDRISLASVASIAPDVRKEYQRSLVGVGRHDLASSA